MPSIRARILLSNTANWSGLCFWDITPPKSEVPEDDWPIRLEKSRGLIVEVLKLSIFVVDDAMGTDAVAKVDVADDFARGQIDDQHFVAIEAGVTDADIAVDGNVGDAAVRGCSGFMTVHDGYAFGDGRDRLFGGGVDKADVFISLVDDDQQRRGSRCGLGPVLGTGLGIDGKRKKANTGEDKRQRDRRSHGNRSIRSGGKAILSLAFHGEKVLGRRAAFQNCCD